MRTAIAIAAAVRGGRTSAARVVEECLDAMAADDRALCAVTRILADRARTEAAQVDAIIAAGGDPGPLAGVPYGVKDLFDITGLPTTAGSALYADAPPAAADAEAIGRLRAAGAVLVATLNMDEFAYGFATINARHGTTRNPHDPSRLAGGSSGGSAAAVAAGFMPFSLGSDTNGSIRVPASLTGLYGIKPTHGALPMQGVFPFVDSFDDIGPFALSAADMALLWGVLAGAPASDDGAPIRVARLAGRFARNIDPDQGVAMAAIAPDAPEIEIADIARARSAAFLMTAREGADLHLAALSKDAMLFDPQVRDRLLAGALIPDTVYEDAVTFRAGFRHDVLTAPAEPFDVLLAPATPCTAPLVDDPRIEIDGAMSAARADLGIHAQPISFLGLPSLAVPLRRPDRLPIGLQLIGRPGGEGKLFRYALQLEQRGLAGVTMPAGARLGEIT